MECVSNISYIIYIYTDICIHIYVCVNVSLSLSVSPFLSMSEKTFPTTLLQVDAVCQPTELTVVLVFVDAFQ